MQMLYIKFYDSSSNYSSPYTSVTDRRTDGRSNEWFLCGYPE